jgi:heme/copper-type cytochrome/quinol oxidase subunit 2
MNVKDRWARRGLGAFLFGAILICAVQPASAEETYKLSLKDHKFTPNELTVPANERFLIEVENLDATPAEFESTDLKVEKFVVGGGKITVRARALKPGTYKFYDEYNPEATGTVVAVEAKPKQ